NDDAAVANGRRGFETIVDLMRGDAGARRERSRGNPVIDAGAVAPEQIAVTRGRGEDGNTERMKLLADAATHVLQHRKLVLGGLTQVDNRNEAVDARVSGGEHPRVARAL